MALVRCRCNQSIKVPAEQFGELLVCPNCKKRFRVAGVRAEGAKSSDHGNFTFIEVNVRSRRPATRSHRVTNCSKCAASLDPSADICVRCGHVVNPGPRFAPATTDDSDTHHTGNVSHASGVGRYLKSCAGSLLVGADVGNFVTMIFVMILAAINAALITMAFTCILLIPIVIITGLLAAFFFNIVVNAANGDDDLPNIGLDGDWFDDIIIPFVKFLTACLVALAPLQIYIGVVGDGGVSPSETFTLLTIGVCLWPITVLVLAIGGLTCFLRPDRIFLTVLRTFVPYLVTCAVLAFAIGITWALQRALVSAAATMGGNGWAVATLLWIVGVYCLVVAMQCIGLYYYHFKNRFAWSWG
jgi:hypothetical protein